jgi:hypothetical protein
MSAFTTTKGYALVGTWIFAIFLLISVMPATTAHTPYVIDEDVLVPLITQLCVAKIDSALTRTKTNPPNDILIIMMSDCIREQINNLTLRTIRHDHS